VSLADGQPGSKEFWGDMSFELAGHKKVCSMPCIKKEFPGMDC
jgi:hypothetical protein